MDAATMARAQARTVSLIGTVARPAARASEILPLLIYSRRIPKFNNDLASTFSTNHLNQNPINLWRVTRKKVWVLPAAFAVIGSPI
jgi:hypothetical protein